MDTGDIVKTVKAYILEEFLPGEAAENLTETTPLLAGGILDSLMMLKLVAFLEQTFRIQIRASEMDEEYFGDLTRIAGLVTAKMKA